MKKESSKEERREKSFRDGQARTARKIRRAGEEERGLALARAARKGDLAAVKSNLAGPLPQLQGAGPKAPWRAAHAALMSAVAGRHAPCVEALLPWADARAGTNMEPPP